MQLNFQIPDKVIEAVDKFVDGIRFRNRAQLITVILADWLARMEHPVDPFAVAFFGKEQAEKTPVPAREEFRREILGDDLEKYRRTGADVLDGEYEERRSLEQLERQSQASEERERLKSEILEELRGELVDEVLKAITKKEDQSTNKKKSSR